MALYVLYSGFNTRRHRCKLVIFWGKGKSFGVGDGAVG